MADDDEEPEREHWVRPKRCKHGFVIEAQLCRVAGCVAASPNVKQRRGPLLEDSEQLPLGDLNAPQGPLILCFVAWGEKLDELESKRDRGLKPNGLRRSATKIMDQLMEIHETGLTPPELEVLNALRDRAEELEALDATPTEDEPIQEVT